MIYTVRKWRDGKQVCFRVEPEDLAMERFDFDSLTEALADVATSARGGDEIRLVDEVAGDNWIRMETPKGRVR